MSGKKLAFLSLPYKFINAFSVESAGMLSQTVEATLFVSKIPPTPQKNNLFQKKGKTIDFGKKETDIFEINNLLANKLMKHTTHQT